MNKNSAKDTQEHRSKRFCNTLRSMQEEDLILNKFADNS